MLSTKANSVSGIVPPASDAETAPENDSDEALVRRVLGGERAMFEVLVRRNNARLYRAIRSLVSDEAAVEEAMQETYVNAFLKLGQFNGGARFSTWLLRIGLNEGLQHLRRNRKWALIEGELARGLEGSADGSLTGSTGVNPERQAHARAAVQLLEAELLALPEIYRLTLVLREVEGLSAGDAAEAMGISVDALKQRLFRGRQLLRERMEFKSGE